MPRSMLILIAALAVLANLASASGDERSTGTPISLEQALEIALASNPRVRSAGYRVEAASAGVVKAGSGYLPRVEIIETYQKTTNPMWAFGHKLNQESISPADFAPDSLNNPDPIENWGTTVTLSQPLYSGGRVAAYMEQAVLAREASLKDRERTLQEVIFEVTKAYYGVTLAETNLDVVKTAMKSADENMRSAQAQRDAGVIGESDYLGARENWAGLKEEEARAANALLLSRAALNYAMGVGLETDYRPSERPSDDMEKTEMDDGPVREAGKQADPAEGRPDLEGMRLREEMGEKAVRAARAGLLPTMGLTASYEIDGRSPAGGEGTNWTVMGVLKWSLFNGYEDTSRVSEARAESDRMKEMRREMENGIRVEALGARLELKAARESVNVAKENVNQAEEGFRIVKNRYNEGMTTAAELLATETALKKAKQSLSQAIYDYKVGQARLKLALGILK